MEVTTNAYYTIKEKRRPTCTLKTIYFSFMVKVNVASDDKKLNYFVDTV